jgi:hypothetical protein
MEAGLLQYEIESSGQHGDLHASVTQHSLFEQRLILCLEDTNFPSVNTVLARGLQFALRKEFLFLTTSSKSKKNSARLFGLSGPQGRQIQLSLQMPGVFPSQPRRISLDWLIGLGNVSNICQLPFKHTAAATSDVVMIAVMIFLSISTMMSTSPSPRLLKLERKEDHVDPF